MNKVESGFSLIGLMDGTTINGFLRVEGNPLVQRYNKGTNQFIPDFESDGFPEASLPVAVLILRDTASGTVMIPQTSSIEWKYNGVALTFGSNGLCTTDGLEGMFKKIDSRPTQIGDSSYNLPAVQVLKNLVPISGYDNDRLSVSGSVEVGGNSVSFSEISKEVIIQETTGNAFSMTITDDKGFYLVNENDSLTAKCTIYKDGNEVSDYSGVTFKWEKLLGTGNVAMGTPAHRLSQTPMWTMCCCYGARLRWKVNPYLKPSPSQMCQTHTKCISKSPESPATASGQVRQHLWLRKPAEGVMEIMRRYPHGLGASVITLELLLH